MNSVKIKIYSSDLYSPNDILICTLNYIFTMTKYSFSRAFDLEEIMSCRIVPCTCLEFQYVIDY